MKRILAGILMAASCGYGVDANLLKLVDRETRTVMGISVNRALTSPVGRAMLNRALERDRGLGNWVAKYGFNLEKDFSEVVTASNSGATGTKPASLLLAGGVFDSGKFFDAIKAQNPTISSFQGVDIVTPTAGRSGSIALLGNSTLMAGDMESIKAAIGRRNDGSGGLEASLDALVKGVSSANDIWFASLAPVRNLAPSGAGSRMRGSLNSDAFRNIEQTSGGIRLGTTVECRATAIAASEKDATAMSEVVKLLASMVPNNGNQQGRNSNAASILQQLQVQTSGKELKLSLALPEATVLEMLQSRPAGTPAAR
jgi:hypothetical protein